MDRRNLAKEDLDSVKFDILVRFMIVAAERKRLVEYGELTKVFGISLQDLRDYAKWLGDYCVSVGKPPLSALIVNTTDGRPGDDYYVWYSSTHGMEKKDADSAWGKSVADCFVSYKVPINNAKRFENIAKISKSISTFLNK
ncbi:MAG: hypothetical protein AUJ49_01485 [Desulfovibrionaceae bacterium CG1_02_65_16]|nr:MAG: hypothetical protein AUJ49_01485 [Desulfovibrionaceae bacterium CG1_02_65_16]